MGNFKIKLNNGILEYKDDKWYRNGKEITGLHKYKFYDPNKKSWMGLSPEGKIDRYSYLNRLEKEASLSQKSKRVKVGKRVPISNDIISLRTNGRMNFADIPVNMLDSIAINTGRSGTNIKTNLGLVGKETTFGGHSKALGNPWPKDATFGGYAITNNHNYFLTPEGEYLKSAKRLEKAKGTEVAEANTKYAYKHGLIERFATPHYHNNIMADSFARYAANPHKYNPIQDNYSQMVTNIGKEVWSDPQIQNWWNTQGKEFYNKGLNERKER